MSYGLTSFGAYVPRLRLKRAAIAAAHRWMAPSMGAGATGARAFCSWDEDAITMAVEAARDALGPDPAGRAAVASLALASTTLPYADLSNSGIVAGALDLPQATRTSDRGGSQRAATSALIDGFRAGAEGALIVAADRPRAKPASPQEMQYGAGAAAVTLGSGDVIAAILGAASLTSPMVDRFRPADRPHDYVWEERWIRDEGYARLVPEAIAAALADAGLGVADIAHLVLPALVRGAAKLVAGAIGFKGALADPLETECGHAGVAHGLLMLGRVLEDASAGERIVLVGFGQGVDALVLEATGTPPVAPGSRGVGGALADAMITEDYLRMLSFYGELTPDWGMRGEKNDKPALTDSFRSARQLAAFKAGKCPVCAAVQFPQMACCVTPGCGAPGAGFEQISLADAPARQLTWTADWLSYHEAPPLYVGFVQFDNGARLLMETVDAPPEAVDSGIPLRMVFRIKQLDAARGFRRYFWKATPTVL